MYIIVHNISIYLYIETRKQGKAHNQRKEVLNTKKTVKDGWHTIAGKSVYIENGYIKRGISDDGQRTTYPYSAGKYDGWDLDQYMTPDTFRNKVKNGSAAMF